MDDATVLRKNLALYFAPMYRIDPLAIAQDCDEEIDPTGELLGYVREEAAKLPPERFPPTGGYAATFWSPPTGGR